MNTTASNRKDQRLVLSSIASQVSRNIGLNGRETLGIQSGNWKFFTVNPHALYNEYTNGNVRRVRNTRSTYAHLSANRKIYEASPSTS